MKLTINGAEETLNENHLSVARLLEIRKVESPDMVTVELNGSFLDRKNFATTMVRDGDQVEFLYFMGGGSRHAL